MKWFPLLAFGLGAFVGRWTAHPSEAPVTLSPSERRYVELGKDAAAFLNWYRVIGGDEVEEAVLRDNIRILQSKAVGNGFVVQNGTVSNPPD